MPSQLSRVLVPVDQSECARWAVEYAAALPEDSYGAIDLLHVLPASEDLGSASQTLRALPHSPMGARMVEYLAILEHRGLHVRGRLHLGDPLETILSLSKSGEYDLIIMGFSPRTGLRRLRGLSLAQKVVRRAACAVISISAPTSRRNSCDPTDFASWHP